jgi:NADH:ubiquinone oxidoreductase subunit D
MQTSKSVQTCVIYQDLSGNKFATIFLAISRISAGVHERLLSSIFAFCDNLDKTKGDFEDLIKRKDIQNDNKAGSYLW